MRAPAKLLAFASMVFASTGAAFAFSACTSTVVDNSGTPALAEAGTDTGPKKPPVVDAGPDDTGPGKVTQEQCFKDCYAAHSASQAKYDAVDTCWAAHCQGPCVDYDAGPFDSGADAGKKDDAGGVCGTDVTLEGFPATCAECTEAFCCGDWQGCFAASQTDCLALNDCFNKCPQQ